MIDPKHILRVQAYVENVNSRHLNPPEELFESFAELILEQQDQIHDLRECVKHLQKNKSDNIISNIWSGT